MLWRKKETPDERQKRLEKIVDILFPPLSTATNDDGVKFHIDYSADANLDAAISDLEDNFNDPMAHRTLRGVSDRLARVRRLLSAYRQIESDAKYIVVVDPDTGSSADDIVPADG